MDMKMKLSAPKQTGPIRKGTTLRRVKQRPGNSGMEIVLQPHMVLIRTTFAKLQESWMADFLTGETGQMLYLPRALLLLHANRNLERKEAFFRALCDHYAKSHELNGDFFLRALMRSLERPVKIELDGLVEPQTVTVELYAHDSQTVTASLYAPNRWVLGHLQAQLAPYVRECSETQLTLDLSDMKAKARLERALNKRHLLHYSIQYRYDSRFMERLYADYADFYFEDEEEQQRQIEAMMHYYTVLECPVGASQDALRKSYKKLVKVYHPDRVHCEDAATVNHYTQKFQLLQEAYSALRIVS
jgi:hypothetical protein